MSNINVATAPKTAMFQMRINPEIKQEAENVFSGYGLSLTDAFNIFLQHQIGHYHSSAAASGGQDDAGRTAGRDDKACHATPRIRYRARHVRCWPNHCRAAHG